jgi:signal transduction histidine kinase
MTIFEQNNFLIKIIVFILIFSSLVYGEDLIYPYEFRQDTTITGLVIADGHIFDNASLTYISIYNTFTHEKKPPSVIFYNENFSPIDSITLSSHESAILRNVLVFDFDGDSFDEIVFAISDPDKIWFLYFDPSNSTTIKSEFFNFPFKDNRSNISINMITAQLDEDDFVEIIISTGESSVRQFTINGIWAVDIEKQQVIWENFSANNLLKTEPVNFVSRNKSIIVYAGSSIDSPAYNFSFSNGYFHYFNHSDRSSVIYDKNFNTLKKSISDTLSMDYSCDSVAFIKAIDSDNNLIWKRTLSIHDVDISLSSFNFNGSPKLIVLYSSNSKNGALEIVDPLTGNIEKSISFEDRQRRLFTLENEIIVSYFNTITKYNEDLNQTSVVKPKFKIIPIATYRDLDNPLIFAQEGSSVVQSLVVLDDKLEKVASFEIRGLINFLNNSHLASVYDSGERTTKLFSIRKLAWFDTITTNTLRNLVISFLLIILVTMFLWINTLRHSWGKIARQKNELEASNKELKETTAKLVEVEKLAVYGTIASSIAHEINSPLGAIINSAQRIRENKDADLQKNIDLIEKAGKRSKSIIEKLLLGTRDSKEQSYSNLNDVIKDWKELSLKQFDNLGISLETNIGCNNNIAISATELNQILTNLLFNARDSIMERNFHTKTIRISSEKKENKCIITVQDTGTGFSPTKLKNPFEAFKTSKGQGLGTGLGLWVVKNIIDQIGGDISISNWEMGAEVKIIIPLFLETINE